MTVDDIDRFEVNEAFASVIGAWLEETGADWDKTNVWGRAIDHGYPLGASVPTLLGKFPYKHDVHRLQAGHRHHRRAAVSQNGSGTGSSSAISIPGPGKAKRVLT